MFTKFALSALLLMALAPAWAQSQQGLPPGLTLSPSGSISGTVPAGTTPGTYSFNVQACDNEVPPQCATQPLSIQVIGTITFVTTSLPPAITGVGYGVPITVQGGLPPYNFSIPAGGAALIVNPTKATELVSVKPGVNPL